MGPDRLTLCAQWLSFLNACQQQQTCDIITCICKMNTFDRKRLVAVLYTWMAYTSLDLKASQAGNKTSCCASSNRTLRLHNVRSKTQVDESIMSIAKSKASCLDP